MLEALSMNVGNVDILSLKLLIPAGGSADRNYHPRLGQVARYRPIVYTIRVVVFTVYYNHREKVCRNAACRDLSFEGLLDS